MYRCGRFGNQGIEIILTDWFKHNGAGLSYADLEQFDIDVLNIENPQMIRYLLNGDSLEKQHDNKYMNVLKKYVDQRKKGVHDYKPQSDLKF